MGQPRAAGRESWRIAVISWASEHERRLVDPGQPTVRTTDRQFDLKETLWRPQHGSTRKDLTEHTGFPWPAKARSLRSTDDGQKPAKAAAMSQAYVEELTVIRRIEHSAAHRERISRRTLAGRQPDFGSAEKSSAVRK